MINYISGGARARTYVREPRRLFLDAFLRHGPPVHHGCHESGSEKDGPAGLLLGGGVHGHGGGERHGERHLHEEEYFVVDGG